MTVLLPIIIGTILILFVPYFWRIIKGPTLFDRVVALNALGSKIPAVLILIGLLYGRTDLFIDLALALFLLSLVTTLLIAKFVEQKEVME